MFPGCPTAKAAFAALQGIRKATDPVPVLTEPRRPRSHRRRPGGEEHQAGRQELEDSPASSSRDTSEYEGQTDEERAAFGGSSEVHCTNAYPCA